MLDAGARQALRNAVGPDAFREHAPLACEGLDLPVTLRPAEGAALAASLRALASRGLAALVRGGGSRLGLGNLPRTGHVLLSTEGLAGIDEYEPDEGVLRARAGTPLGVLREAICEAGWELPFDPPGARATLGGTLAAAAVGPQHAGFGRPRDAVLGLDVVLGDGTRTRCGGRVVKNVTGYDLVKLHVGALGTLGVIEAAWVRLRPLPERTAELLIPAPALEAAVEAAVAVALRPGVRVAALVDGSLAPVLEPAHAPGEGLLLLVELAGDTPVVEGEATRLAEKLAARPASLGAVERLRDLHGDVADEPLLRFRVSALPARFAAAAAELLAAGAGVIAHTATGLLLARFPLPDRADETCVDAAWRAARRAAAAGAGDFVLESAPIWAREARDVFGNASESLPLLRALKQRFDPDGVLNPGRFVAGL